MGLTYKDSGVDIEAGNELVKNIKPLVESTNRRGVMGGFGGFGSLFELPTNMEKPVLVSGTDGVGTKLILAADMDTYDTIGIDLVAMCVNDIVVTGAEPLYFLDYFATGNLNIDKATEIISGIAEGCRYAGCALTGGETAEMPSLYSGEDFDLAGFAVGVIEKDHLHTRNESSVGDGDIIIGIHSSGPHSNGYSLIRKIIDMSPHGLDTELDGSTVGELVMEPTRIYVKCIRELIQAVPVGGIAHITGGGLIENIPRMLPDYTHAKIDLESWQRPAIFNWLEETGDVGDEEMVYVFNCGIGMVLTVPERYAERSIDILEEAGESASIIGRVRVHDDEKDPTINF